MGLSCLFWGWPEKEERKMKEEKRGGRKPAPVPTGHDQRAAARDHSVPHGNRKNDAIPPSKAHAPDGISGYWG